MDMSEWEVFEGYHQRHSDKERAGVPWLTITQHGPLALNQRALQLLNSPSCVLLAYNRSQQIIRISACGEDDPRGIPVRQTAKGYMIAGKSFTSTYDIDTSRARRYTATLRDGKLYIDLSQAGEDVTRERKGITPNGSEQRARDSDN